MRRNSAGAAQAASVEPKAASPLAGLVFILAMGAAFWAGALWAAQPWAH